MTKDNELLPLELSLSSFVPRAAWDACIDKSIAPVASYTGVDASVKHGAAVIEVSWDQDRSRATFTDPATGEAP